MSASPHTDDASQASLAGLGLLDLDGTGLLSLTGLGLLTTGLGLQCVVKIEVLGRGVEELFR